MCVLQISTKRSRAVGTSAGFLEVRQVQHVERVIAEGSRDVLKLFHFLDKLPTQRAVQHYFPRWGQWAQGTGHVDHGAGPRDCKHWITPQTREREEEQVQITRLINKEATKQYKHHILICHAKWHRYHKGSTTVHSTNYDTAITVSHGLIHEWDSW